MQVLPHLVLNYVERLSRLLAFQFIGDRLAFVLLKKLGEAERVERLERVLYQPVDRGLHLDSEVRLLLHLNSI